MGLRHYNQNQLVLFPHTFEDLISNDHPGRIVNDKVNISTLVNVYRKEGNPSYHPLMRLKVMVFAYMENIYSKRILRGSASGIIYSSIRILLIVICPTLFDALQDYIRRGLTEVVQYFQSNTL